VPEAAIAVDRRSVEVVAVAVAAYQIHRLRDDPVPGGVWVLMTRIPDCCCHCCCYLSTTPSLATSFPLPRPLRAVDSVSAEKENTIKFVYNINIFISYD